MSDPVELGPGFVSNYPPFAFWTSDAVPGALAVLDDPGTAAERARPLGAYLHVPFCRKRCRFCYFKVFTEVPAAEVRAYVDTVLDEARLYAAKPAIAGRTLSYLYVGGGTPSYLSSDQIHELLAGVRAILPLAPDAELTFECEPGTVRLPKMEALVANGVTRVSLGVESFDERVLELNGRAHQATHIAPAFAACRDAGVPQINADLLAGLIGETDATWRASVEQTIALRPDSVTVYQLEIPANTAIHRALRGEEDLGGPIADVATRRRWADEAFRALQAAGYTMTSGYTAVLGSPEGRFVYRDALWRGADMVPLGVSSFGQIRGRHLQNDKRRETWAAAVAAGRLPVQRAFGMTPEHRLIREFVLQLKLGRLDPRYFLDRYGVDVLERFRDPLATLVDAGLATVTPQAITLTWDALMQVDALLPGFFLPEHRLAPPAPPRPAPPPGDAHA